MFYVYLLLIVVTISNIEIQLSQRMFLNLEPAIIALMWLVVFFRVSKGREFRVDGKLSNSIVIFVGLALASNVVNTISGNMSYRSAIVSTAYLLQFATYISVLFLIPFFVDSPEDERNCLRILFLCFLIILFQNVYIIASGRLFTAVGGRGTIRYQGAIMERLSGFWDSRANVMGGYVVISIMFYLYMFLSSTSRILKIANGALIVFLLITIPYTFSRATLLMLITGLVSFFVLFEGKSQLILQTVPIILICVLLGFVFSGPLSAYIGRFQSSFQFLAADEITYLQANKRVPLWISVISELFSNHHFLYGYGFFQRHTDNMYLQILYSAGMLGFLPFLYFLGMTVRRMYRSISSEKTIMGIMVLAAFVSFLVYAAFGDRFAGKRVLIPLFVLVGLYFRNIVSKDEGVVIWRN